MSDLTVSRIEQLSGPRGATVAFGGTPKSPLAIQALTDAVARIEARLDALESRIGDREAAEKSAEECDEWDNGAAMLGGLPMGERIRRMAQREERFPRPKTDTSFEGRLAAMEVRVKDLSLKGATY